ncbi:quinone oxidoreductase [Sphingomonas koreensis]|uniref:Quinone oxidoreductase n=1 Tax=Sphingomonas koreensis TaxID=93064 RepID=A0A1L6JEK0_9SPHN|nr:quinone oxidoreductase [Sphingomonas koreensis]APR54325.1 quinone oxidoreductase [Sphingomonas koreensis]MDC7809347.1 quinone oxidoreductase [Sphingomonas koreensis]RSU18464.1 quinone oxidoreductase [Sphingomonas koreensis]RSU22485.1 quinone oxidoreductase [Sphingomonas koreensis]RSU23907.1 quinone oxidoreductase [Sphingomonas koreensis]
MARVAVIEKTGGPEVILWTTRDLPPPGPGEVRVRQTAVGLNFIDTYHRSGLYPVPLPSGLGGEAAGVVEAVGAGVASLVPGDRVATYGPGLGAYASERNVPADILSKLPDAISDEVAAAVMLKGCTAEYLVERAARVQPGMTVLVHAAAGGTGQLLVQWIKHLGATVIGTAGSPEKAARARALGADHVIEYKREDIAERVREITGGAGVPVVLDGVGGSTWEASLKSAARRGLIVSFGNAGGPVEGVNLGTLSRHGSLFVTRPTLYDYYASPEERAAGVARVFELVASGVLSVEVGQRFALEDAAAAHRAIEAGETMGATLLIP